MFILYRIIFCAAFRHDLSAVMVMAGLDINFFSHTDVLNLSLDKFNQPHFNLGKRLVSTLADAA